MRSRHLTAELATKKKEARASGQKETQLETDYRAATAAVASLEKQYAAAAAAAAAKSSSGAAAAAAAAPSDPKALARLESELQQRKREQAQQVTELRDRADTLESQMSDISFV